MALEKVYFDPCESVTFMPDARKQAVALIVHNPGNKTLIFKMKSTRPGLYKMRPTYGKAEAGAKTEVRLTFSGIRPGQPVPPNDHFTCIYTVVPPSADTDAEKLWKNQKFVRGLAGRDIAKQRIYILYKGHNDQTTEATTMESETSGQKTARIRRERTRERRRERTRGEKEPRAKTPATRGHKEPPMALLFREIEPPDSESEKRWKKVKPKPLAELAVGYVTTRSCLSTNPPWAPPPVAMPATPPPTTGSAEVTSSGGSGENVADNKMPAAGSQEVVMAKTSQHRLNTT